VSVTFNYIGTDCPVTQLQEHSYTIQEHKLYTGRDYWQVKLYTGRDYWQVKLYTGRDYWQVKL
jgi:hypothetical protein